jgi:cytokinin dehydrogenase
MRLPQEEYVSYIALLRAETNDRDVIARMLAGNRMLYEYARDAGGALYPFAAVEMTPADWRRHYGERLEGLIRAKRRYDPHGVFASAAALDDALP